MKSLTIPLWLAMLISGILAAVIIFLGTMMAGSSAPEPIVIVKLEPTPTKTTIFRPTPRRPLMVPAYIPTPIPTTTPRPKPRVTPLPTMLPLRYLPTPDMRIGRPITPVPRPPTPTPTLTPTPTPEPYLQARVNFIPTEQKNESTSKIPSDLADGTMVTINTQKYLMSLPSEFKTWYYEKRVPPFASIIVSVQEYETIEDTSRIVIRPAHNSGGLISWVLSMPDEAAVYFIDKRTDSYMAFQANTATFHAGGTATEIEFTDEREATWSYVHHARILDREYEDTTWEGLGLEDEDFIREWLRSLTGAEESLMTIEFTMNHDDTP